MQFLLTAYDGTDEGALGRRMAARADHLAGIEKLKAQGHFLAGGAIVNDEGKMIGSACMLEFPTRADLDAWLATDPYVIGKVWLDISVQEMRLVPR